MNFKNTAIYAFSAVLFMASTSPAATTVNFKGSYLLPSPYVAFNLKKVTDMYASNPEFREDYDASKAAGYVHLGQNWGATAGYASTVYLIQDDEMNTANTSKYMDTLRRHKQKLMGIYKLRNNTYNKLAAMAFGVFGVESKFGTHWKYSFKEKNQALVSAMKSLTGSGDPTNSRGLTQMKDIPEKIQKNYPQITADTLYDPEYAAVATLGYLAEAFVMVKGLRDNQVKNGVKAGAVSLSYITDENIFDYIPYVYSGRMNKLFNKPTDTAKGATVTDNLYINEMKEHMKVLYFMEKPVQ